MRKGLLPVTASNKSQTPNFTILTNISAQSTYFHFFVYIDAR
jgi:hypothetical protein